MLLFLECNVTCFFIIPQVIIIDVNTLDILRTFRVYSGGSSLVAIKSIEVARRGSNFLINGSDRVLQVYDFENLKKEPSNDDEEEEEEGGRKEEKGEGERGKGGKKIEVDPLQRLQDNVNRMQWKKCTFLGNGNNRFNIYISLSVSVSLSLSLSLSMFCFIYYYVC